jgi:Mg-chelatase subunit ChlD
MLVPQLLYAISPSSDKEVACIASLVPTFDSVRPQDFYEVVEDEKPEQVALAGNEFHFIFIIDRSTSMRGDRIEAAKEALNLFIRGLPKGSKFSILSFGSNWNALTPSISISKD